MERIKRKSNRERLASIGSRNDQTSQQARWRALVLKIANFAPSASFTNFEIRTLHGALLILGLRTAHSSIERQTNFSMKVAWIRANEASPMKRWRSRCCPSLWGSKFRTLSLKIWASNWLTEGQWGREIDHRQIIHQETSQAIAASKSPVHNAVD